MYFANDPDSCQSALAECNKKTAQRKIPVLSFLCKILTLFQHHLFCRYSMFIDHPHQINSFREIAHIKLFDEGAVQIPVIHAPQFFAIYRKQLQLQIISHPVHLYRQSSCGRIWINVVFHFGKLSYADMAIFESYQHGIGIGTVVFGNLHPYGFCSEANA